MSMNNSLSSSSTDRHDDEDRSVPRNLVQMKITIEWATKTYQYARLFDRVKFPHVYSTRATQISEWKEYLENMRQELKEIGYKGAEKEILDLCKKHKLTMGEDKDYPRDLNDVTVAIGDKKWYASRLHDNQAFLYMICYGIFRSKHNYWARILETKWLKRHNIILARHNTCIMGDNNLEVNRDEKRNAKGFVLSFINNKASSVITEKIMNTMKSCLGEYICVRQRKRKLTLIRNTSRLTLRFPDTMLI